MTFVPAGGRHAVVEAVFGVRLDSPPTKDEFDTIIALHQELKEELPKVSRPEGVFVFLGNKPTSEPPFGAHVSFESFQKDGSHEWRVRVEDNAILVNCLVYTRWKEVADTSLGYIRKISGLLSQGSRSIDHVFLQYLDRFNWTGNIAEYDLSALLAKNHKYVGDFAFDVGPLWHSHQGWFEYKDLPSNGRALNRTNITAKVEKEVANVLIDHYIQFEPETDLSLDAAAKDGDMIDAVFEALHRQNKLVLSELLTVEMAKQIQLNGVSNE